MSSIELTFDLTGLDQAMRVIGDLETVLNVGEIGRVLHTGAVNPLLGHRYEHLVQDRRHQRPIHQGRWRTVQDAAEDSNEAVMIASELREALQFVADGGGIQQMPIARLSAMMELRERVRKYPPPLPNQKYKRTYRLFQGWRVRVDGRLA